jgi:hypothetical protein
VDFAGNASEAVTPGEVSAAGTARPPARTALLAGEPNPFNPRTEIRFELAAPGRAELAVHDLAGRRVRTLVAEKLPAGRASVTWDGRDDAGRELPSGVYLCRLRAGGTADMLKLSLVK